MVKEIISLLSSQQMYSYLNELTLYAGVLYMQPSWYGFSSWLHIDITPLGHSLTWPCLFYSRDDFGIGYQIILEYTCRLKIRVTDTISLLVK